MSDPSDDTTPEWAKGGLAALLLIALVVYVVTLFVDPDIGDRISRAGQAVGAIAIAFTLYFSLQQQAEQRRVFGLGRIADLRREYARLVAAAYNVFTDHVDQIDAQPMPFFSHNLEPIQKPPSHQSVHSELRRMQLQLELHDRSAERRYIVEDLVNCLLLERNAVTLVMELRTRMVRMIQVAEKLGASMKTEKVRASKRIHLLTVTDEKAIREVAEKMKDEEIAIFRRDAIGVAMFALNASLAADEAGRNEQTPNRTEPRS